MADLNNTIQAIEHCANGGYCIRCKLRDDRRCDAITSCKTLLTDALELLKEQQPRAVKNVHYFGDVVLGDCPSCGDRVLKASCLNFCGKCGGRIDWAKDGEPESE